ncbi:hypothetical protein B0H16DRAFT_1302413 [Mycena metata]|uniref:CxC2-like cysteine cluster KDZ transposase-associated domain-containing protein n=1 Tax=Mycena metata TaxID=1033252 RepID=A0AAD7K360_9AGAR|nr:hypothetical protein B0H16DRAFT_1302413 [Mycena metata]
MQRKAGKRKAAELELTGASGGHTVFHNPNVKRVHFTVTTDSGSSTRIKSTGKVPRLPADFRIPQEDIPPEEGPHREGAKEEQTKRTQATLPILIRLYIITLILPQNGQLLDDFEGSFEELGSLLLECEADSDVDLLCPCGSGDKCTTKCFKCTGYPAACQKCFVKWHLRNPFHWAEVWNPVAGFFVRHDISTLGHVIQLGHNGGPCENAVSERLFTVVDGNGVHSTRLAFCGCKELPPNKNRQLVRAGLFPATVRDAHSAFTIEMLKEFQLHNFESKKAAYDYLGAIRRLTDNSFTADVANPYAAFLRVIRVFNYLTLVKRSGQLHGIDVFLPHRPKGNLLVWCPGCPEPGFNSDPNCPKTPVHLRHLNQSQRTLDGNHQCNQFSKNTDPDDVSLCAGKAYFPLEKDYQAYLKSVPTSTEASTCNYLKVVNKQDKKKFKNMALTGTVNCQCSHVFILSCVDLPHSERFANSDYALWLALKNHKPSEDFEFKLRLETEDVDELTTYDIACQYIIYLEARFKDRFPDMLDSIKKMRWGVPALHVQGHQDSCTYLFGTAYMECIGHFHGETAEHYWPEANQLGPHVRQMNLGHRQDTMVQHHGDWNYKKTAKITSDLAEDIVDAKQKYKKKRDHFISLSSSFKDRVSQWEVMPRTATKDGKEAVSVYKHRSTKVPSQATIYDKMISDDDKFATTLLPNSKVAEFLDRGLRIQDSQHKLNHLIHDTEEHELQTSKKEISKRTTKLRDQIAEFRRDQKHFMPKLGDKVATQAALGPAIELERLYLPSDLTSAERQKLDVVALGVEESKWREGQVFDILRALQNIVKGLGALRFRKSKNERQQKQNSRAGDQIADAIKRQNQHMESYGVARMALISLNGTTTFPVLTEADLFMKPVLQKRRVGDSKRTDGLLWRAKALSTVGSYNDGGGDAESGSEADEDKQERNRVSIVDADLRSGPEKPEGWIWQLGKLTKMSSSEMDTWSNEGDLPGDRVQWFRAQAEMQRWQEQWEQKLVELLRTIRSFSRMQLVWNQLANAQPEDRSGARAYAHQKAAMYDRRRQEGCEKISKLGYGELLDEKANVLLFVEKERVKEAALLKLALA